jgi:hypothetical protein
MLMPAQRVAASTSRSRNLAVVTTKVAEEVRDLLKTRGPDLSWTFAEPLVRIQFPPAVSLRTIGSRNTRSSVTEPPPGPRRSVFGRPSLRNEEKLRRAPSSRYAALH